MTVRPDLLIVGAGLTGCTVARVAAASPGLAFRGVAVRVVRSGTRAALRNPESDHANCVYIGKGVVNASRQWFRHSFSARKRSFENQSLGGAAYRPNSAPAPTASATATASTEAAY